MFNSYICTSKQSLLLIKIYIVMKKLLLIFVMTMAFAGLQSQVIENFESITMNIFASGTNGAISVVPNPDTAGNPSGYVGKMVRGFDGDPWAGWYTTLDTPIDVTANKYVHVKVWKPRISPVVFKVEGGAGNSNNVFPINPQTLINQWEELVFDMSTSPATGEYVKIVLIPDFEDPLTLTEDIVLYYDEMYVNNDPAMGSAPVQVMEDFETIPLNYLLGGAEDLSSMTKVPNPDISGCNLSSTVIEFLRDKDGVPWGGFWSNLPEVIDVTTNKYIHVKVWKPRISPIKFKIEGGAAGTIEIESMYPQTLTNAWEDIVFDFSAKTGTYPIIAFLPDFFDPVGLEEDITIYFDDVILNNDPNPITPPVQKISVDMKGSGIPADSLVWISGTLGGIYGTWNKPGSNSNNQMLDPDGDSIFSITLSIPEGLIAFKFFWGNTWDHGDTAPGGDRILQLENQIDVLYKWGVEGIVPASPTIQFNCNMANQIALGNFIEGTDYLDVAGGFNNWNGENHHLTSAGDGIYTITIGEIFTIGDTIAFKFRINGDWNTSEFPNGGPDRNYVVLEGSNVIDVWYNDDTLVQTQSVVFTVNMSHQIKQGNFVEATDFVDITGLVTVENPQLTALGDSLYGITVDGFTTGDAISYKFSIIRTNDTIPETISDRTYTVVEGENVLDTVWFNNEVAGINDPVQEVYNIYPNPMTDKIIIGNMTDVNRIEIYNVSGQLVKSIVFTDAIEQTQISTEDLNSGMYIMTIFAGNSTSSTKLLKY